MRCAGSYSREYDPVVFELIRFLEILDRSHFVSVCFASALFLNLIQRF